MYCTRSNALTGVQYLFLLHKPDEAAKRKKTDEPTPDVHPTPPEGAPEEQGGEEVEGSKDKPEESFVAAADDEEEEVSVMTLMGHLAGGKHHSQHPNC